MFVCFSIGPKSKAIITTLSKTADNVEFLTFNTIKEIIKNAKLRHIDFKRIIISSKIVKDPKKEFKELSDFIGEFSDNTEVVLILGEKAIGSVDVEFNKYFNAPMYTPVIMPRANSSSLLELVLGEIASLSVKYYESGVPSASEQPEVQTKIEEESSVDESEGEVPQNVETSTQQSGFGIGFGPKGIDLSKIDTNESNKDAREEDFLENSYTGSNGSASGYSSDFSDDDFYDGDDDLSIGDYGSQHSDTGFLDESDAEELQARLESFDEQKSVETEPEVEEIRTPEVQPQIKEESVREVQKPVVREPRKSVQESYIETVNKGVSARVKSSIKPSLSLNVDLVISTRSYRATQAIIDEALTLYQKDDAKVLIIDLDFKENRILSYLKTGEYYRTSSFEGITKQRIYEEDHVGVCSNGYGVPVLTHDLKSLLSSKVINGYDLVLIDCPVDCLNVIDEELVELFHILVFSGGDRQDLVEMSKGLVNREIVRLAVEKYIMRNCDVEIDEGVKKSDLSLLKKNFLFANGTWLSKITNTHD